MTDAAINGAGVLQTLIVGHLWQSVAVAGVLAAALVLGRRMAGSARHGLAAAAFGACLLLPLATFIPGESLVKLLLEKTQAPVTLVEPGPVFAAAPHAAEAPQALVVTRTEDARVSTSVLATLPAAARLFGAPKEAVGALQAIRDGAMPGVESAEPAAPVARIDIAPAAGAIIAKAGPLVRMPKIDIPDLTLPLLAVWLAGALILLVRVGRDLVAVERMVTRARPVALPKKLAKRLGKVRVAVSSEAPGPMAAGLFRPVVVLPESAADQLDTPEMAALLEHERAHIVRRDMLAALAQRVVLALLWWSPALYWISRRIDEEREVACDEAAVERTGDARAFARSLTSQAENQLWARAPRLAVGAIGPRSQFGRRIRRLIDLAKGAAPARYSGRLAFSGLALAALIAVIVTPRIVADTPQKSGEFENPPIDNTLDGKPPGGKSGDLTPRNERDAIRAERDERNAIPEPGEPRSLQFLGEDIAREIELAMKDIEPELQGLSGELAFLGTDIAMLVNEQVMREMPSIMAEIDAVMAEAESSGDFDREEVRAALEEAREELRQAFGPEFKAELQAAMADARQEIASSREHIAGTRQDQNSVMAEVRAALAEAREEMRQARERGDFHIDADRIIEDVRKSGVQADRNVVIRTSSDADRDSPEWRLFRAASTGDAAAVRKLLGEGVDANRVFRGDGTALIAAARRGNTEIVRLLLADGADCNLASIGDGNPLIAAASRGHADITKLLIKDGADVNAYVRGEETPLIVAARQGELAVVKLLVDAGADVNLAYRVEGRLRSPLGMAEKYGQDGVASYLRQKGAVPEPEAAH